MNQFIKNLEEMKNGNREDKLFYITYLKEMGKLGQRLYKLKQEKWLGDWLIKLYNYIKNYAKNF